MDNVNQPVHVAVGVVKVDEEHVLITKRHDHLHQGGLWEFPGGKVATGETVQQALARELEEELGIHSLDTTPLIQIPFDYGDKKVMLDVHIVTRYQGTAHGREGQALNTVSIRTLKEYAFPAANKGIIAALQLPRRYMITAQHDKLESLLAQVSRAIDAGVRLIQFRAHHLADADYQSWCRALAAMCKKNHVTLIANTSLSNYSSCMADGVHLTSHRLMACAQRPVDASTWCGASVHNEAELQRAMTIGADYILIAPVKKTASHPAALPLGWEQFALLASQAIMPVYALGGLKLEDMQDAIATGAQGIAGIRLFDSAASV